MLQSPKAFGWVDKVSFCKKGNQIKERKLRAFVWKKQSKNIAHYVSYLTKK